jgi:hypothetical protein
MTKLKNELNAFIAKRDKLELLVDDFRDNVKFFLSMELTAELNEQSILEFAKISNFLLCEYEFLYNGKRQTTSRQEMKQDEMVFYDLLVDELNTLDNNYTSEKLDHQDCLLKIIGVSLDDLVVDIKNAINCFKSFFNSDASRLNYRKGQETRNELSNFYVLSVDFGSKHISLDLAAPAFNLNEALLRHPWVSSISRKRSVTSAGKKKKVSIAEDLSVSPSAVDPSVPPSDGREKKKKKKVSIAEDESVSTSKVDLSVPPSDGREKKKKKLSIAEDESVSTSKVDLSVPLSVVDLSFPPSLVDLSVPPSDMKLKRTRKVETEKIRKRIRDYNFIHHDILVEQSFRDNVEKLSNHVAELFRMEQLNEENRRSFFINILSLCAQMKCNFQDLFILLECTVLKIKDFELQCLRSQEFFQSRNKTQRESLVDKLQRKARRFVGRYGRMIYEFLEAYRSCSSEYEQTKILQSLWPLSSLTDDYKSKIIFQMSEIVSSLSAEDSLLVGLSVEGFQQFRADLYSAIQAENVLQMYSAGEQDKCMEFIQKRIESKSTACFSKVSFKEELWRLIGEYFKSELPKEGSLREIPWELRKRSEKPKYKGADPLQQPRKRSKRKPQFQSVTSTTKGCEEADEVVDGSGKVKSAIGLVDDDDVDEDYGDDVDRIPSSSLSSGKDKSAIGLVVPSDDDDEDNDKVNADANHSSPPSGKVQVVVNDDDGNFSSSIIHSGNVKDNSLLRLDAADDAGNTEETEVVIREGISSELVGNKLSSEQTIDRCSSKFPAVFKSVRKVMSRVDNNSDQSSEDEDEDEDDYSEKEYEENDDVEYLLDELLKHFSVEELWENAVSQQMTSTVVDLTNENAVDLTDEVPDLLHFRPNLSTFSPQLNHASSGQSHFLSSEMHFVTPNANKIVSDTCK